MAPFIRRYRSLLMMDDTTLDKPYTRKMRLVTRHWSGNHKRVVQGINVISLLWTQGRESLPCDFRIYNWAENGLIRDILQTAYERGFRPELMMFDSWYAAQGNLKCVRDLGWHWFTRLKANRLLSVPGNRENRPISA